MGDHINGGHPGMSLRDWFAGQALAGLAAKWGAEGATSAAYRYADAMLAKRAAIAKAEGRS